MSQDILAKNEPRVIVAPPYLPRQSPPLDYLRGPSLGVACTAFFVTDNVSIFVNVPPPAFPFRCKGANGLTALN